MKPPKGWRPWASRRRRFRWQWGDASAEIYDARTEFGCAVYSENLIYLHPHLRRQEHHDLRWDVEGHEMLHMIVPTMRHDTIYRLERRAGQVLHDRLGGCLECSQSRGKAAKPRPLRRRKGIS